MSTTWQKPSEVDTSWTEPDDITSTGETENLLDETGEVILDETGENILAEFWSAFRKVKNIINTIWQ